MKDSRVLAGQMAAQAGRRSRISGIRENKAVVMRITLVCVGRIKEKYFSAAVAEYEKRLSRYCRLEIMEVADEKTPDGASEAVNRQIRQREGQRILDRIPQEAYVIALAVAGKQPDSVELAQELERLAVNGVSHIVLVIGGSLGLSPEVMQRAHAALSFSRMTFPHQLMRVILLEQIYRSYRIINHEPYHK